MTNRQVASGIVAVPGFALASALFFCAIVGVFGLPEAIISLIAFVAAALLSFRLNPAKRMEP